MIDERISNKTTKKIPYVARIPIDPELAALCDAGRIEANQGRWLGELADEIAKQ